MYKNLIKEISQPLTPGRYYKLLLDNAEVILIQVAQTSKAQVAKDLGMTPQVFATAIKFIASNV